MAQHQQCAGVQQPPGGDWFCSQCAEVERKRKERVFWRQQQAELDVVPASKRLK